MYKHTVTFLVVILTSLVFVLGEQGFSFFIFSREGIENRELWRLLSGFLVHFSTFHLISNLIAFIVLSLYLERFIGQQTLLKLLLSLSLFTSLSFMIFSANMLFYGGLSAINYGLFVYVVISFPFAGIRTYKQKYIVGLSLVLLTGIFSHIFFQSYTAESLFSLGHINQSVVIAWQSHLYGVLVAIAFGLMQILINFLNGISVAKNVAINNSLQKL